MAKLAGCCCTPVRAANGMAVDTVLPWPSAPRFPAKPGNYVENREIGPFSAGRSRISPRLGGFGAGAGVLGSGEGKAAAGGHMGDRLSWLTA